MDFSQYIRLKNEAANQYVSRMKTVDSSFLTLQKQQKGAFTGYNDVQAVRSDKGSPVLNNAFVNTLVNFKNPGDTTNAPMKMGYTSANRLSQNQDLASRKAGGVICNSPNYTALPAGMDLINCKEYSTITTQHNDLAPVPGVWNAYGYGKNQFFPRGDNCTTGVCKKDPLYPS
jgi:hypothetical protein